MKILTSDLYFKIYVSLCNFSFVFEFLYTILHLDLGIVFMFKKIRHLKYICNEFVNIKIIKIKYYSKKSIL